MQKILSRGSNIVGQIGLGKHVKYSNSFVEIPNLPLKIKTISTGLGHNFILLEDNKTLLYWGFNFDIRSFFRVSNLCQKLPRLTNFMKKMLPQLNTFPYSPSIIQVFENPIIDVKIGGGHCLVLDNMGICHSIGENSQGQNGSLDIGTNHEFFRLNDTSDVTFTKISAGFQHSLFLTDKGVVYGCGKNDKMQLGRDFFEAFRDRKEFRDIGTGPLRLNLNIDEKIIDIGAGKYHSVFLTGVNRFGQIGKSNYETFLASDAVLLEFPEGGEKISEIQVGDNHNLMLSSEGVLFGNGDNSAGQIDGDVDNFLYYNCAPKRIFLPTSSEIVKIYAKNNRSAAILRDNKVYFWGGFYYDPKYSLTNLPKYSGFNSFHEELGVPNNCIIEDIGLGLFHDLLLVKI